MNTETRDKNGRFVKGHEGGPGRPKLVTERAYLEILRNECPPETWREVVKKAIDDASTGDAKAREWLSSYLLGKPGGAAPTLHQMAVEVAAGVDETGITNNEVFMVSLDNLSA